MSLPEFPWVDPELTRDQALNMILTSIAMEELALSHIINAEGEKLQYVLGTLESSRGRAPTIDEVLAVNHSVTCLMDSVSQNQMILKSKMDKALCALEPIHPGPPGPPGPPGKCSAVYEMAERCQKWRAGSALNWGITQISGACVRLNHCDDTKVDLCAAGRYAVSFAVDVRARSCLTCDVDISLQMVRDSQCTNVYTAHDGVSDNKTTTVSMGGVIVEAFDGCLADSLSLKLVSLDSVIVECATLSIISI